MRDDVGGDLETLEASQVFGQNVQIGAAGKFGGGIVGKCQFQNLAEGIILCDSQTVDHGLCFSGCKLRSQPEVDEGPEGEAH